jgi:hypothetical protein
MVLPTARRRFARVEPTLPIGPREIADGMIGILEAIAEVQLKPIDIAFPGEVLDS